MTQRQKSISFDVAHLLTIITIGVGLYSVQQYNHRETIKEMEEFKRATIETKQEILDHETSDNAVHIGFNNTISEQGKQIFQLAQTGNNGNKLK